MGQISRNNIAASCVDTSKSRSRPRGAGNAHTSFFAMRGLLFVALSVLLPGAASANTIVIGAGPAQQCFELAQKPHGLKFSQLAACNQALDSKTLAPRDVTATLVNRGILYGRLAQHRSAIEDFDAALRLNPKHIDAYLNRGNALARLGRYYEALIDYDRVIELGGGTNGYAWYNRALANFGLGDRAAAEADLRRAVALAPTHPEFFELLAEQTGADPQ